MEQIKEANNLFKLHATQLSITLGGIYKSHVQYGERWLLIITTAPSHGTRIFTLSMKLTGSKFRRDRKECFSTQRRLFGMCY